MNSRLLTRHPAPQSLRAGIAALLFAALVAMLVVLGGAAPAHAAGRVDVSPAPNADGETIVTLSGSGFQYLPNAPGGVYVSFGVVQDPSTNSWAPSQGGKSGATFGYAATGGTTILVSFAGGSSAEAANALIEADGTWTAEMKIPGSSFPSISGNPHAGEATEGATIDCLQVQCGIITFGAHGMVNANNESFTPVSFVTADGSLAAGTAGQTFTEAGEAQQQAPDDEATAVEIPAAGGEETGTSAAAPSAASPAEAAPPAAAPVTEPLADSGISSTGLVLGVLGLAVAALLAAVVVALVRRRRARQAALAGATDGPEGPDDPEDSDDPEDPDSPDGSGAVGTSDRSDTAGTPAQTTQIPAAERTDPPSTHPLDTQVHAAATAVRHQEGTP